MDTWNRLYEQLYDEAERQIRWQRIEALFAPIDFAHLRDTPQNPVFHGEGDVFTHTAMVCDALVSMDRFHCLERRKKAALLLAAVLHDIGKGRTTRMEDGAWVSPRHAAVGSKTVRSFLWRECGLCGNLEAARFRESICMLIRRHMLPINLLRQPDPERTARLAASVGECAADFSWELLCMLAEADVRGRLADDREQCLEQVELARLLAEECGCLRGPYPFADAASKRAYLSGRNIQPDQPLFDPSWGEVLLVCGLPGTGKDTWIRENCPSLPMISLDEIRRETGAPSTGEQAKVARTAQERAKKFLRAGQPFVWNATNLTREIRREQLSLFEKYGARTRVIWLETAWETGLEHNAGRAEKVPPAAIEAMLEKTVPPFPEEAHTVIWQYV